MHELRPGGPVAESHERIGGVPSRMALIDTCHADFRPDVGFGDCAINHLKKGRDAFTHRSERSEEGNDACLLYTSDAADE